MSRATPVSKCLIALLLALPVGMAVAGPDDQRVEQYLRENRMDQLLEVQLEERLESADSDEERAEIGRSLSQLYLRQLRELDRDEAYREVMLIRAQSLVDRLDAVPLHELRLELLIDQYLNHERKVELRHLLLLNDADRQIAIRAMKESIRGLESLLAAVEPDLERLTRRRTRSVVFSEQQADEQEIDHLQRMSSLAHYYEGWAGYSLAVLEDRHVSREPFIAFGWLLGMEGGLPQSRDLSQAAIEYEHVARSAIGVALCYSQSEDTSLATMWLEQLIDSENTTPLVRDDAQGQLLRVLAMGSEWYDALVQANLIISESEGGMLSVADARFVTIMALTRRGGAQQEQMESLASLGIEQLIEHREIGHVVDLYKRFERLPMLKEGFIPNYARALAELEREESQDATPGYLALAELFNQALKSRDADEYPEQRDDCRLKLAYTLIRADRPKDALLHCQRVLETSIDEKVLEEARWVQIAALDRMNTLAARQSSPELDAAVRAYVESYPSTQRTAKLVLRHAMRGTLDEQLAIETLESIADDDPIALPARRTLLQLQYQLLRGNRFSDLNMLRGARSLADWILEKEQRDGDSRQTPVGVLQIAVDLSLRDAPPDSMYAREHIEIARQLIASQPSLATLEPEMLSQLIRAELLDDRIEEAMVVLDELRVIDPDRADDAQMLVLNTLIEQWSIAHSPRVAQHLVEVGSPVIARVVKPDQATISVQTSSLIEIVAEAAQQLAKSQDEPGMLQLALRLSKRVLDAGQPSEPGLRRTAALAAELNDPEIRLEAWLRLLAAYPQGDERWYEARYLSLSAMQDVDPDRAFDTFKQYKVLNPTLGPAPWNERIANLFGETAPENPAP